MLIKENFYYLKKFSFYLRPYRFILAIIFGLGILAPSLTLVNPFIAKLVIDNAFATRDLRLFIKLVILGGGTFFLHLLLESSQRYLTSRIKSKLSFRLHKVVMVHLAKLPLSYFRNKTHGEQIFDILFELEKVISFIVIQIPEFFSLIFKIIITLAIIAFLNFKLAVITMILAPILYIVVFYFSQKRKMLWKSINVGYEQMINHLAESFLLVWMIKAFGKEKSEVIKHLHHFKRHIKFSLKSLRIELAEQFLSSSCVRLITGLIIFLAGYLVVKEKISLGSLSAITLYLNNLVGLHSNFALFLEHLEFNLISLKRIDKILETEPLIRDFPGSKNIALTFGPKIEFKNVTFGYSEKLVLSTLNFEIPPATHIALVGPSGCGKTTIINLILRLYEPWSGSVLIDGYDLRGIKLNSLKKQIGVALQEPQLWNSSIEDNIRYGCKSASEEKIRQVAKLTLVEEFVEMFPQKYDTPVGEMACKISDGQKQKIAIARALIKEPKILILDEAMSSMDSNSEKIIINNIKREFKKLTIISVSHRLSTVLAAELVYYLISPDRIIIDSPKNMSEHEPNFRRLFALEKTERVDY